MLMLIFIPTNSIFIFILFFLNHVYFQLPSSSISNHLLIFPFLFPPSLSSYFSSSHNKMNFQEQAP